MVGRLLRNGLNVLTDELLVLSCLDIEGNFSVSAYHLQDGRLVAYVVQHRQKKVGDLCES